MELPIINMKTYNTLHPKEQQFVRQSRLKLLLITEQSRENQIDITCKSCQFKIKYPSVKAPYNGNCVLCSVDCVYENADLRRSCSYYFRDKEE